MKFGEWSSSELICRIFMSVLWFVVFVWCSLHVQSSPRGKYRGVHSKPGAQKTTPGLVPRRQKRLKSCRVFCDCFCGWVRVCAVGNTSSNHWFSGDMSVFRGVAPGSPWFQEIHVEYHLLPRFHAKRRRLKLNLTLNKNTLWLPDPINQS